jgi:hypothetical protein
MLIKKYLLYLEGLVPAVETAHYTQVAENKH